MAGLYSATLFEYSDQAHLAGAKASNWAEALCSQVLGKRSLDYLWYGIGAFLSRHQGSVIFLAPNQPVERSSSTARICWFTSFLVFLPAGTPSRVFEQCRQSPSGRWPRKPPRQETGAEKGQAHAKLVDGVRMAECGIKLARAKQPIVFFDRDHGSIKGQFTGDDYNEDFKTLKHILSNMGCSIPPLYKQYSELCEPGGLVFLDFGVDPGFMAIASTVW